MMHACLPCTGWLTCLSKPWAKNPQIEFKHADKCGQFKEIKLPTTLIPIFIFEFFFSEHSVVVGPWRKQTMINENAEHLPSYL